MTKTYADTRYGRATSWPCGTPGCKHRLSVTRVKIGYCSWCVKAKDIGKVGRGHPQRSSQRHLTPRMLEAHYQVRELGRKRRDVATEMHICHQAVTALLNRYDALTKGTT